jgi:hypothetical protein
MRLLPDFFNLLAALAPRITTGRTFLPASQLVWVPCVTLVALAAGDSHFPFVLVVLAHLETGLYQRSLVIFWDLKNLVVLEFGRITKLRKSSMSFHRCSDGHAFRERNYMNQTF